jgi:FMN phosphatase YigB (HAD superfamily)
MARLLRFWQSDMTASNGVPPHASAAALGRHVCQPSGGCGAILLTMDVRVVFVDWHKTLSTSLLWEQRSGCRPSPGDSARVERYVFSRAELLPQWMLGEVAAEDVCTSAAGRLGLAAADLLADLKRGCSRMKFDDLASVDALRAIREQGIKVVLATDNMDTFPRWTVPALQLHGIFDAILDSASLGVLKDDLVGGLSPFFGPWLSDQRVLPSEAVLVDDTPPASAAAIGLETRRVEPRPARSRTS